MRDCPIILSLLLTCIYRPFPSQIWSLRSNFNTSKTYNFDGKTQVFLCAWGWSDQRCLWLIQCMLLYSKLISCNHEMLIVIRYYYCVNDHWGLENYTETLAQGSIGTESNGSEDPMTDKNEILRITWQIVTFIFIFNFFFCFAFTCGTGLLHGIILEWSSDNFYVTP